jgi:hypothetical protein
MKKRYISIALFIVIILILLGGCGKKEEINHTEIFELKTGRYIYGDTSSPISCETIMINTDDKSFTHSSSPLSSYLTYGEYSVSDDNDYTLIDEMGTKQSFTVEDNAINYNSKSFLYYNEDALVTPNPTTIPLNESTTVNEYNQFDQCTMEIVDGTITPTGLTVRFTSANENETDHGSYFRVEKYDNSEWNEVKQLELQGDLTWTDEAYPIPTDGFRDCVIDWSWLYGELTTGQYRIIKDIIDFRGTGDYDEYYLAAEFEIE